MIEKPKFSSVKTPLSVTLFLIDLALSWLYFNKWSSYIESLHLPYSETQDLEKFFVLSNLSLLVIPSYLLYLYYFDGSERAERLKERILAVLFVIVGLYVIISIGVIGLVLLFATGGAIVSFFKKL